MAARQQLWQQQHAQPVHCEPLNPKEGCGVTDEAPMAPPLPSLATLLGISQHDPLIPPLWLT